jgi:DNA-binding transcriptional ArsR family regulator
MECTGIQAENKKNDVYIRYIKNLTYIYVKFNPVMVQSKTALFDAGLQRNAELFKALSHPARLAILRYLAETRTCITGDITEELPLSRTTVNQHLKELKKTGLIQGTIEGVRTNYCLNASRIRECRNMIQELLKDICCDSCS